MSFWDFVDNNGEGLGVLTLVLSVIIGFVGCLYVVAPSEKIQLEREKTRQIELTNKCNDHEEKEKE